MKWACWKYRYSASDQRWHRQASGSSLRPRERSTFFFEACLSDRTKSRHQPDIHRWEVGGTGYRNLSIFLLGETTLSPPGHQRGKERKTTREKNRRPTCPVEAPLLPDDQHVTTSPPSPVKEEGDVTPNDADIPDSIARALLDALPEKRTRNQLPATMISLARVGGAQLQQQWLATGRNHHQF